MRRLIDLAGRWARARFTTSVEACVLAACAAFVALYNIPFWRAFLAGRDFTTLETWKLTVGLFMGLTMLHFVVLALFCTRWTTKPILIALCAVNAVAAPFMMNYGVYLDPTMIRNILQTDLPEASEYLSVSFVLAVLGLSVVPILLIGRVTLVRRPLLASVIKRVAWIGTAVIVAGTALLVTMQDVAPMLRTQRQLRYLITPGNYLYSIVKVTGQALRPKGAPRAHVLATNTHPSGSHEPAHKPVLFVLVIGETARADNFSLNGYARETNPRLSKLDVINFENVMSCGTATEVSLPCMLSAVGRKGYQDDIADREDGLIQVLAHAGYDVNWYDNNSGCKGTCDGDDIGVGRKGDEDSALCSGGRCLDQVLLNALDRTELTEQKDRAIVLHQLGNHGPAYYQRYPAEFARFKPTCDTTELRACTLEQIVNTYDNAILYTDHVLAEAIGWLQRQSDDYNTVLLYVGDHGESLGESGLYLHGMPYAIAPHVQTHVPMILWVSPGFADDFDVAAGCVRSKSTQSLSHDNLFHSVVGLLSLSTQGYQVGLDLFAGCKGALE